MKIKKCITCKKVFVPKIKERICNRCREKEDEMFEKVKDYLFENPNSTLDLISEETEVEKKLIRKFIEKGRLILNSNNSNLKIECKKCGKTINVGKYCIDCSNVLNKKIIKIKNHSNEEKETSINKEMFTSNIIKK